ncbi:MAG TPA: uL15 family ribosomal protein [Candidatus Paceibacterota bacterium]|nr:uL15 family ribosomal protein [Candidatus Paceibacterota bacterium]
MQLNTLSPRHSHHIKRAPVGRGGKRGKTSGRGGKGQTARAGHKIRPEARDLIKKIPKRRGYGKNRALTVRTDRVFYTVINLVALENAFKAGDIVSPATLLAKRLIRRAGKGRAPKVKILGVGELTKALVVRKCTLSASAKSAIEKAGGTINA